MDELPSLTELLKGLITAAPVRESPETLKEHKRASIEATGREEFFGLRKVWSKHLARILTFLVGSQIVTLVLVGFGGFDFSANQWFINLVMGENFVVIIGLCYVVVKYLFSEGKQ
ncbi:hypothetical protein IIA79_02045 [bacterium]|nr:hypothetical protein [bacterium]